MDGDSLYEKLYDSRLASNFGIVVRYFENIYCYLYELEQIVG